MKPITNHQNQSTTTQNLILLTILLAVFVVPSSISGTAIALEFIAQSFSDTLQTPQMADYLSISTQNATFSALLQWVVNSFNLCFATFTLIWGALADRFGARKCLILGVLLYLIGSALSTLAPNLLILDIARGIAGLGGASVFSCGASILIKTFSEDKRAKAFALFGTTAGLGITLSPTICGLLIDAFANVSIAGFDISIENSWRSIFAFHFLVLFVVLALSPVLPKDTQSIAQEAHKTPQNPTESEFKAQNPAQNKAFKKRFDTLGAILFIAFLFSFMLFITRISEISSPFTLGILSLSIVAGIAFGLYERYLHTQGAIPLLDFSVLSNAKFVGFTLVCVVAGFSFVVLLTYFPQFLQRVFGFLPAHSGIFMLFLTAPMLFCPIIAGKILAQAKSSDTPKILSLAMSLMMSLGTLALIVVVRYASDFGESLGFGLIALVLFIVGVGMGLHAGAIDNLALSSVEEGKSGFAAGVLNCFRLGSEAVGVALYGALMALFSQMFAHDFALNSIAQSQNLINAFSCTLGILGIFCIILTAILWRLLARK
ncbi:MFS transporter [Helicobacter sp. T3_23-1059]